MADGKDATIIPNEMQTAEVNGAPSNGKEDDKTVKSLEQRYIELLEEKIARLEAETKPNKKHKKKMFKSIFDFVGDSNSKDEKTDDEEKAEEEKKQGKEKGTQSEGEEKKEDKEKEQEKEQEKEPKKEDVRKKDDRKSRVRKVKREVDEYDDFKDEVVSKFDLDIPDVVDANEQDNVTSEGTESDPWALEWRLVTNKRSKKRVMQLLIKSTTLKKALKAVLQDYPNISFDTSEIVFSEPYEAIYHNIKALEDHAKSASDDITRTDINILLKELEQMQLTERRDAQKLMANGRITYELLWTLFYPGCKVCQKSFIGAEHVSIVAPFISSSEAEYSLRLWSVDYNGTEFKHLENKVNIKSFKGSKGIADLEVYPLEHWKGSNNEGPEDLKKRLIQRGENFEKMCTAKLENKFLSYGGPAMIEGTIEMLVDSGGDFDNDEASDTATVTSFTDRFKSKAQDGTEKLENESFVMVDLYAYLTYGKMPIKLGQEVVKHSVCGCTSCTRLRKDCIGELPSKSSEEKSNAKLPALTPEQRLLCPPRVFGFAVRRKVWVQLLVENVKEITQIDKAKAFEKLELDKKNKDLLQVLVLQHSKNENVIDDLIPGKGNGLIVLLHGPPGVGKTLTAESLAILSGKPLYSVSMSDVGTSPTVVEKNFIRIFELATHWKAILLFDEADVFLEARSLTNLRRNSLVSVLIRILEYFEGILFLTSNRVKTFDEAFQSRIHVAVQYKELSETNRINIWKMWLERAGNEVKDSEKFDEELNPGGDLAKVEINGRQIRNVFRSAMALANARGIGKKALAYSDIEKVLKSTVEFQVYMNQNKELAQRQNWR